VLTSGPEATVLGLNRSAESNTVQTKLNSNLTLAQTSFAKKDIPKVKKIEIKYGCEGFKEGNDFLHRNMFRFEMYFKLKFRESKVRFRL
jgi:hypothetical protein